MLIIIIVKRMKIIILTL